ncbi:MAG TPA: hypothetical protein VFC45_09630 [Pseudolabrys sp.]|nr:hypothetical protein [Pseudolabrys sp.]
MISIVNGYVCTSSCDAASARAGKDPNAPPGTLPEQSGKADKKSGLDGQPATLLGGALQDLQATNGLTPASDATPPNSTQQSLLNLLA